MHTHWFSTPDGGRLRYTHWPLAGGRPALILTGRGEPSDKYAAVADELRARGFAVWGLNWRGQGGSSITSRRPRRGYIRTFDLYLRDLSAFMRHLEADHESWRSCQPTVVAHSMGAHLALRSAHDHPGRFGQLVLAGPMVGIVLPARRPVIRAATELLAAAGRGEQYVPGGGEGVDRRFEGNQLTYDRGRFDRYLALLDAQPDLITGGATVGWLRAALASLAVTDTAGFAERVQTPTLLFAAADDTLVSPADVRAFAARLPKGTFVQVPAARHELFQASDAVLASLWRQIDAFLR